MKILNLGLDNSILDKDSKLAKRAVEYGNLVEKYIVIAPFKENKIISLSDKTAVYGVGAKSKTQSLFKIYNLAKKLIREENIDVVSVQDQYYLGLVGFLLARKFKKGLEIQVHGFEKYSGIRKFIAKYVLPHTNTVRAVSQRLKRRLIEEFKVKEERIVVVPIHLEASLRGAHFGRSLAEAARDKLRNPVDKPTAEITSLRRGGSVRNDKFIFLTVGRLVPVKNIGMQLEAIAEIIKKYPNIELWVVGEGGDRTMLEKLCYELRITSYVKFFGWQDDLDRFYSQADMFLLTSYSEGWPLVILEAANYGLPIIMTDVGSAGELIVNNESGIVIPVNDEIKLKEAMMDLIKNSELRRKIGEGARRAVFNLPAKEKILEMYKKSWELALRDKK